MSVIQAYDDFSLVEPKFGAFTKSQIPTDCYPTGLRMTSYSPHEQQKAANIDDDITGSKEFLSQDDDEVDETRGTWGQGPEFILSCLGYAVGLGNVWRFPYMCYNNGGGAFLIPYTIMLLLCGIPLFFIELSLGQYTAQGPMCAWECAPIFQGIGAGMVVISILGSIYYNLIIAWSLYYMFYSFRLKLPWIGCQNDWNSYRCFDNDEEKACESENGSVYLNATCFSVKNHNSTPYVLTNLSKWKNDQIFNSENYNKSLESATEQFFNRFMLNRTEGLENMGSMKWDMTLALLVAWLLTWLCVVRGIQSSGKVVYFTATFPYLVIVILLIKGVTLEGAGQGIHFYIGTANFTKLAEAEVWGTAAGQIFFSLSVGMGGLMTFASFNKFHTNVLRDTLIVSLGNCLTSVFAGFAIFSILGHMAYLKGVHVKDVVNSGSGLAFIAYPDVVTKLPFPPFWSFIFFFMLLTLGLDSQFAGIENIGNACMDMKPSLRKYKTWVNTVICVTLFILGLPLCMQGGIFLEEMISYYSSGWSLVLIGLAEGIVITYIYGVRNFIANIEHMLGKRVGHYWKQTWKFFYKWYFMGCWLVLTPILLIAILVYNIIDFKPLTYGNYKFPVGATIAGWIMALASVLMIPIFIVIRMCRAMRDPDNYNGCFGTFKSLLKPSDKWMPAIEKNRLRRLEEQAKTHVNPAHVDYENGDIPMAIYPNEKGKEGHTNPAMDYRENNHDGTRY